MELDEIWLWYCEHRLGKELENIPPETFSPDDVLERLWVFLPMFTGRHDAIEATKYSKRFDGEADGALSYLATENETDGWDKMSAGAWRVLQERLTYCLIVICANKYEKVDVIDRLPAGLDRKEQSNALLLKYLLGHGRTVDRKVLPVSKPGTAPAFPPDMKLRKQ